MCELLLILIYAGAIFSSSLGVFDVFQMLGFEQKFSKGLLCGTHFGKLRRVIFEMKTI